MRGAALLLVPVFALAQNPYEGIYIGTYQGTSDDGEFALIVNNLGYGTLAAYDAEDDIGYVEKNIRVRSDGSFRFVTQRGAHIDGQASADGVSGSYYATGTEGSFAGQLMSAQGPLANAAGYYSGQVSITRPGNELAVNGRMVAIIAADGSSFFLLDQAYPGHSGFGTGGLDIDFDLDLGWGLDFDFDFGAGFGTGPGFGAGFGAGSGGCWPFGSGLDYSYHFSIFGFLDFDVDFSFGRPSCSSFWSWGQFPGTWGRFQTAFTYSGGAVQIEADGMIQDFLLDGLMLEGNLDPHSGSATGTVSLHRGANAWRGHWTIERRFSTANAVAAPRYNRLPDVDGNGNADILWRHSVTGGNAVWLMDSAEIAAELSLAIPAEIEGDLLWSLAAVMELNADGRSDYVWRNTVTGEVLVSFGDDMGSVSFELGSVWKIVGSGDFNADALPEILVTHGTSGANALIADLTGNPSLTLIAEMEDPAWSSVSVADFDGDNSADVLLMNRQSRDLLIWLMNGATPAEEVYLPAEMSGHHELAGVGDFDQDGSTDILRRDHAAGTVIVSRRLGEDGGENVQLGADVPRGWKIAAVGDLDGDGSDDLVWRQSTTGDNVSWRVVDTQVADTASLMPVPDLRWTIQQ
jgi:hypothetical protein